MQKGVWLCIWFCLVWIGLWTQPRLRLLQCRLDHAGLTLPLAVQTQSLSIVSSGVDPDILILHLWRLTPVWMSQGVVTGTGDAADDVFDDDLPWVQYQLNKALNEKSMPNIFFRRVCDYLFVCFGLLVWPLANP